MSHVSGVGWGGIPTSLDKPTSGGVGRVPTPSGQTETCAHYLPATSFAGGNNTKGKNIFTEVLNSPRASEISFVVTTTAIGCPLPRGLPQVTMSGITSVEKNIIVQARMLQPLPATKKQA